MCLHLVKNYNNLFLLWFVALVWFLSACTPTQEKNQPPSAQELRARWHNNQGVVYMDQHNYTRGREAFQRAIELAPHYTDAHTNIGISHYSLGQYDSAMVALHTALKHDRSKAGVLGKQLLGLVRGHLSRRNPD